LWLYHFNVFEDNELMASQWLEDCGYSVDHRGSVVSVEEPWISANPDIVLNSKEQCVLSWGSAVILWMMSSMGKPVM
jgi:hypothetical protein